MTDDYKYKTIVLIAVVVNIGCHLAYDIFHIKGVWYIGNAFAWVCCGWVLYKILPSIITSILFALTIQQLIDEFFNDTTRPHLIEYIGFVLLVAVLIWKRGKVKIKNINENGK